MVVPASESFKLSFKMGHPVLLSGVVSQDGKSQVSEVSETGVNCVPIPELSQRFLRSFTGFIACPIGRVGGLDLQRKLENMEDKLNPLDLLFC